MLSELTAPLTIGNKTFAHRLIQGPLAGISAAPFRASFQHFCLPAYAVTEMISAKDLVHRKAPKRRYLERFPGEAPLCYQLSGDNPEELALAVKKVAALGADLVDLNCGCPQPKIRNKQCGSKHLESPEQLGRLVKAMREATDLPLTVKIRTQGQTNDLVYLDAVQSIVDNGADALIVHGRHWQENYETRANYETIAKLKQTLSIPVIANGDITDPVSLQRCVQETGADAFMVARGGIGQPWIFQSLFGELVNHSYEKRVDCFIEQLHGLADIDDSEHLALLQGRRLLPHYFKDMLDKEEISKLFHAASIESLRLALLT